MKARVALGWAIGTLLLAGLACQTGQILTPEEATARALATAEAPVGTPVTIASSTEFQAGQVVEFSSKEFLVPIYEKPGDTSAFYFATRGDEATIVKSQQYEGETWYFVKSVGVEGWVPGNELKARQGEAAGEGPQPGDTAYLTGKGYLINLMESAGSKRIVAGQERGVEVTILEIVRVEDTLWYKIEAPTGVGWVPKENITSEAP